MRIRSDPPAQIIDGSTMVPVRFVSEALGASVQYDPKGPGVVIAHPARGQYYLSLANSSVRLPDGSTKSLTVGARNMGGRVFVPNLTTSQWSQDFQVSSTGAYSGLSVGRNLAVDAQNRRDLVHPP